MPSSLGQSIISEAAARMGADDPYEATAVERNEAVLTGDDRLVGVYVKMRAKVAELNDEYKDRINTIKQQMTQVETELLRRLHERGATQTKTDKGTAFIGEDVSITIADENQYAAFVLAQGDTSYYQKRAKVERVKEYMGANNGMLPPGLSIFREKTINVRVPTKKGAPNASAVDDSGAE